MADEQQNPVKGSIFQQAKGNAEPEKKTPQKSEKKEKKAESIFDIAGEKPEIKATKDALLEMELKKKDTPSGLEKTGPSTLPSTSTTGQVKKDQLPSQVPTPVIPEDTIYDKDTPVSEPISEEPTPGPGKEETRVDSVWRRKLREVLQPGDEGFADYVGDPKEMYEYYVRKHPERLRTWRDQYEQLTGLNADEQKVDEVQAEAIVNTLKDISKAGAGDEAVLNDPLVNPKQAKDIRKVKTEQEKAEVEPMGLLPGMENTDKKIYPLADLTPMPKVDVNLVPPERMKEINNDIKRQMGDDQLKQEIIGFFPGFKKIYGDQGQNLMIQSDKTVGWNIEFVDPGYNYMEEGVGDPYQEKYNYSRVIYNPLRLTGQAKRYAIMADMLHGMEADPQWVSLREEFEQGFNPEFSPEMIQGNDGVYGYIRSVFNPSSEYDPARKELTLKQIATGKRMIKYMQSGIMPPPDIVSSDLSSMEIPRPFGDPDPKEKSSRERQRDADILQTKASIIDGELKKLAENPHSAIELAFLDPKSDMLANKWFQDTQEYTRQKAEIHKQIVAQALDSDITEPYFSLQGAGFLTPIKPIIDDYLNSLPVKSKLRGELTSGYMPVMDQWNRVISPAMDMAISNLQRDKAAYKERGYFKRFYELQQVIEKHNQIIKELEFVRDPEAIQKAYDEKARGVEEIFKDPQNKAAIEAIQDFIYKSKQIEDQGKVIYNYYQEIAPDVSFAGGLKSLALGEVADIYEDVHNLGKFMFKLVPGLGESLFGKDWENTRKTVFSEEAKRIRIDQLRENVKMPSGFNENGEYRWSAVNLLGDVTGGLMGFASDLLEMSYTMSPAFNLKTIKGIQMISPRFANYLGLKSFVDEYAASNPDDPAGGLYKAGRKALEGYTEGFIMDGLGMAGHEFGKPFDKLIETAVKAKDITKAANFGVAKSITNGFGVGTAFSAYDAFNQLVYTGSVEPYSVATSFGTGLAFTAIGEPVKLKKVIQSGGVGPGGGRSLPGFFGGEYTIGTSILNDMATAYFYSDGYINRAARNLKTSSNGLYLKAINLERMAKIADYTDPAKADIYRKSAQNLKALSKIRAGAEMVGKNADKFREVVESMDQLKNDKVAKKHFMDLIDRAEAAFKESKPLDQWAMTKEEFDAAINSGESPTGWETSQHFREYNRLMDIFHRIKDKDADKPIGGFRNRAEVLDQAKYIADDWMTMYGSHEAQVRRAIADGKPVPQQVLDEYPDLRGEGLKERPAEPPQGEPEVPSAEERPPREIPEEDRPLIKEVAKQIVLAKGSREEFERLYRLYPDEMDAAVAEAEKPLSQWYENNAERDINEVMNDNANVTPDQLLYLLNARGTHNTDLVMQYFESSQKAFVLNHEKLSPEVEIDFLERNQITKGERIETIEDWKWLQYAAGWEVMSGGGEMMNPEMKRIVEKFPDSFAALVNTNNESVERGLIVNDRNGIPVRFENQEKVIYDFGGSIGKKEAILKYWIPMEGWGVQTLDGKTWELIPTGDANVMARMQKAVQAKEEQVKPPAEEPSPEPPPVVEKIPSIEETIESIAQEIAGGGAPRNKFEATFYELHKLSIDSRVKAIKETAGPVGVIENPDLPAEPPGKVEPPPVKPPIPDEPPAGAFIRVPLSSLTRNLRDFQARDGAFNLTTVDRITGEVERGEFNESSMPSIMIWKDLRTDNWVIVSGHSRTEAYRRLNEMGKIYKGNDFSNINAQVVEAATIEQAREIARNSNFVGQYTIAEKIKIIRDQLMPSLSGKDLRKRVDELVGKNEAPRMIAYAHLNPDGMTMAALRSFNEAQESVNTDRILSIAQWVGEMRKSFPELTDAHENELFEYLFVDGKYGTPAEKKTRKDLITSVTDFYDLVNRIVRGIVSEFDSTKPLNLHHRIGRGALEIEAMAKAGELQKAKTKLEQDIRKIQDEAAKVKVLADRAIKDIEDDAALSEEVKAGKIEAIRAEQAENRKRTEIQMSDKQKQVLDIQEKIIESQKDIKLAREGDAKQVSIFDEINKEVNDQKDISHEIIGTAEKNEAEGEKLEQDIKVIEDQAKDAEGVGDPNKARAVIRQIDELIGNKPEKERLKFERNDEAIKKRMEDLQERLKNIRKNTTMGVDMSAFPDLVKAVADIIAVGYYKIEDVGKLLVELGYNDMLPHLKAAYGSVKDSFDLDPEVKNSMSNDKEIEKYVALSEDPGGKREAALVDKGGQRSVGVSGGASAPRRPPIRIADQENLPDAVQRYVIDDSYGEGLDGHQQLGVNLAMQSFFGEQSLGISPGRAFLLADGTGVGKTRQIIATADQYAKKTGKKILIVSIKGALKGSFPADAKQMDVDLGQFELATYEDITSRKAGNGNYGLVIFDEAHNMKNLTSLRAQAGKDITRDHTLYVTATPMDKAHHAIYFLGDIMGKSSQEIQADLGIDVEVKVDKYGKEYPITNFYVTPQQYIQNLLDIRKKAIADGRMIRREYPFFGEITETMYVMPADLSAKLSALDELIEQKAKKAESAVDFMMKKGLIRAYPKNSDGYMKAVEDYLENLYRTRMRITHTLTEPAKADIIAMETQQAIENGNQVVIVVENVNTIQPKLSKISTFGEKVEPLVNILRKQFRSSGIEFVELLGSDSPDGKKYDMAERRFNDGDVNVLIMTSKSGGTGRNLDARVGDRPRKVLYATPAYGGDTFEQTIGRFSRRNTDSPVDANMIYFKDNRSDMSRRTKVEAKKKMLRAITTGEDLDRQRLEEGLKDKDQAPEQENTSIAREQGQGSRGRYRDFPDDFFSAETGEDYVSDQKAEIENDFLEPGEGEQFGQSKMASVIRADVINSSDPRFDGGLTFGKMLYDLTKAVGIKLFHNPPTNRRAAGDYSPWYKFTRSRYANNLLIGTHEFGHGIDDKYFIIKEIDKHGNVIHDAGSDFEHELAKFWDGGSRPPSGHPDPQDYKRSEGFAEWFRYYVLNPVEGRRHAPGIYQTYVERVPEKVRRAIDTFSIRVRSNAGMDMLSRPDNIRFDSEKRSVLRTVMAPFVENPLLEKTWIDSLKGAWGGQEGYIQKAWDKMMKRKGINGLMGTEDFVKMLRITLGFDEKLITFLENGWETPYGGKILSPRTGRPITWEYLYGMFSKGSFEVMNYEVQVASKVMVALRAIELVEEKLPFKKADSQLKNMEKTMKSPPQWILDRFPELREKYFEKIEAFEEFLDKKQEEWDNLPPERKEELTDAGKAFNREKFYWGDKYYDFTRKIDITGQGGGDMSDYQHALETIKEFRSKDPDFRARIDESIERHREFADAILSYMVDGDVISMESFQYIKEHNLQYVALNRYIEAGPEEAFSEGQGGLMSSKMVDRKELIFSVKGSAKELMDPYESLLRNMANAVREVDENRALLALVNPVREAREMHQPWAQDQLADILHPYNGKYKAGQNIITVKRNGEKELWQLDRDLYMALENYSRVAPRDAVTRFFGNYVSKTIVWSVTRWPIFALRNRVRDFQNRLVISQFGFQWSDLTTRKDAKQMFLATGGGQFGYYFRDKTSYTRFLKDSMETLSKDNKTLLIDPMHLMGKVSEKWTKTLGASEIATRLEEFNSVYKRLKGAGVDDFDARVEATFAARNLLDFKIVGTAMRSVNAFIPFSNARMQGFKAMFRSAVNNPAKFAAKFAMYVMIPQVLNSLIIKSMGDDAVERYKNQPWYRRDLFYTFPVRGSDWWVMIPKPFEIGLLGSMFGRLADHFLLNDKDAFDTDFIKWWARNFLPVDAGLITGDSWSSLMGLAYNYDSFRERYIIPPDEVGVNIELREGTKYASKFSKAAAKGLEKATSLQVDPRNIDYILKSMTNYFGNFAIRASNIRSNDEIYNMFDATLTGFAYKASPGFTEDVTWVKKHLTGYKNHPVITDKVPELIGYMKDYNSLTGKDTETVKLREQYGKAILKLAKDLKEYAKKYDLEAEELWYRIVLDKLSKAKTEGERSQLIEQAEEYRIRALNKLGR